METGRAATQIKRQIRLVPEDGLREDLVKVKHCCLKEITSWHQSKEIVSSSLSQFSAMSRLFFVFFVFQIRWNSCQHHSPPFSNCFYSFRFYSVVSILLLLTVFDFPEQSSLDTTSYSHVHSRDVVASVVNKSNANPSLFCPGKSCDYFGTFASGWKGAWSFLGMFTWIVIRGFLGSLADSLSNLQCAACSLGCTKWTILAT